MVKYYVYCIAVIVTFPWLAGCSCSYSASTSAGTTSANAARHRPEHEHERAERKPKHKAPREESATVSTEKEMPQHGSIGASASKVRDTQVAQAEAVQTPDTAQAATLPQQSTPPTEQSPVQQAQTPTATTSRDQVTQRKPVSERTAATTAASESTPADTQAGKHAKKKKTRDGEKASADKAGESLTEQAKEIKLAASMGDAAKTARESATAKEQQSRGSILIKAPSQETLSCTLAVQEAPRGGKIEISGKGFGTTPIVRIAGKVVRILRREESLLSVQVPDKSDGGAVTVTAQGVAAECGRLTVFGKNR
jgi:hypothetical protein